KIGHIKQILGVRHAHGHAFVNRAGGAPVHRFECVRVIEIGIPTRDHSVFADKDELGRKRACPIAHLKGRSAVPDGTGWICALGVTYASGNDDNVWIRETGRRRAVLKILSRNSSSIVCDKYRL